MCGFINMKKIMRKHISVYVRTQRFSPEFTQSFMNLAPGCRKHQSQAEAELKREKH